jgi:DNA-binding winged helix-turn-helix (wHTH) protein
LAILQQRLDECEAFEFGQYRLIPSKRILTGQKRHQLGSRAFDILELLVRHRGEIVSRREILQQVWPGLTVDETNLHVQISGLRRVLGSRDDGSEYIKNVPGRGYVFVGVVRTVSASGGQ